MSNVIGVRKGQNLYRSGIAGPVPYGQHTLPGLLAPSKAYEAVDAAGHPFALIHMPATRHVAVVLACEPEGSQLVDQDTGDNIGDYKVTIFPPMIPMNQSFGKVASICARYFL